MTIRVVTCRSTLYYHASDCCCCCCCCLLCRADEESAKRTELEKVKREMDNQIEELREDLEAEKGARTKAEKQRRELGEVMQTSNLDSVFAIHLLRVESRKRTKLQDTCGSSWGLYKKFLVRNFWNQSYQSYLRLLTLSLPRVLSSKLSKKSWISIVKNKQHHLNVLFNSFHLNGHILGFHPQTQKKTYNHIYWLFQKRLPPMQRFYGLVTQSLLRDEPKELLHRRLLLQKFTYKKLVYGLSRNKDCVMNPKSVCIVGYCYRSWLTKSWFIVILQELESLKSELEESIDTTVAAQDMRQKRESELMALKRGVEENTATHEAAMGQLRQKHASLVEELNVQLETTKKV